MSRFNSSGSAIRPATDPDALRAFIAEPTRLNPLLRLVIWLVERDMKQRFVPGRLLGWSPRTAISLGVVGWIGDHPGPMTRGRRRLEASEKRLVGLAMVAASHAAGSPYCVAVNLDPPPTGLTSDELEVLRSGADVTTATTFTPRERTAITYARRISSAPIDIPREFVAELAAQFTEREIVVLAATVAAVNYQARLIEALGAPPPG